MAGDAIDACFYLNLNLNLYCLWLRIHCLGVAIVVYPCIGVSVFHLIISASLSSVAKLKFRVWE